MTSQNKENYSYIEEEDVELPDNVGFETEWVEFGNMEMETEPDSIQGDKKNVENLKTVLKKTTTSKKRNKNSSAIKLPPGEIDSSKVASDEESAVKKCKSTSAALFDGNALFDGTYFSFVGEYFIQSGSNRTATRKFKGKCELCDHPVYIVGSGSSTYNFLRHLKRKHGQNTYASYISYKSVKSPKVRSPRIKSLDVKNSPSSTTKILGTVTVYVADGPTWNEFGNTRNKRALNSLILAEGKSNKILNDVQDFLCNSAWYHERSVPYRRSFLLHGPSGCGKSSFVFALASELNFGLCVLYASDRKLTDNSLNHLLNTTPENCIILIEDIDAAFPILEHKEHPSQLTSSGILNCLDGVTASEGRILFMTCVDIDRLNPSLMRPGRVDVREHLGFCSQDQIVQLFKKFCGGPTTFAVEFMQEVIKHDKNVSPAQLQGFFSCYKRSDFQRLMLQVEHIWDF